MYWGLGLMPGTSKKWKASPRWCECWKCSKYGTAPTGTAGSFGCIWYLIHAFSLESNLQISCVFVVFDIKTISNVAQATFCKVFLLYTYSIPPIL